MLFPEAGESPGEDGEGTPTASERSRNDGIERGAISIRLSIASGALIGLLLNFMPWGIRLESILASVSACTLIAVAVAAMRRLELSPRGALPGSLSRVGFPRTRGVPRTRQPGDATLDVLLVISVLLATASVGYAVALPMQGEEFTELSLLTDDEERGLVAAD